jgi:hypothetical protein
MDAAMKRSNLIAFVVTLVLFGTLVPLWKGIDFLDPILIAISANLSLLFVAPLVANVEGNGAIRSRIGAAVSFAFSLALLIVVNAIATVNMTHWMRKMIMPGAALLGGALALNAASAIFLAVVTAVLLRRMEPERVKRTMRTLFLVVLLGFLFMLRLAPPALRDVLDENMTTEALARDTWIASGILLACAGVIWRKPGISDPEV